MSLIKWKYCRELKEVNKAIEQRDPEWPGLTSAKQIISIQFEQRQAAYLVVWMYVD